LTLSTQFPFGLVERRAVVTLEDELIVYPRLGHLTRQWYARHREQLEGAQQKGQRESRQSHEFFGVRTWQQGDSFRWIHWRSSARHSKWVVRQFEHPQSRDLAVFLDLGLANGVGNDDKWEADLEKAISFTGTIVRELCREGGNTIFLGIAGSPLWWARAPASLAFLRVALHQLAVVEPGLSGSLANLWEQCVPEIPPGAEVVVITLNPDLTEDGLLKNASGGSLRTRHRGNSWIIRVGKGEADPYWRFE
jgi:uncharacterized protein (DUF58 family)